MSNEEPDLAEEVLEMEDDGQDVDGEGGDLQMEAEKLAREAGF